MGCLFFAWRIIGSLPLKGIPKEVSCVHLDTTKEASYSIKDAVALVPNQGGRASNTSKSTTNTSRGHLDPLQRPLRQPLRQ